MAKTTPALEIPRSHNLQLRGIESLISAVTYSADASRIEHLILGGISPDGAFEGQTTTTTPRATPLMIAAAKGRQAMVEALLAAGANPHIVDLYGFDALTYAAESGQADTIQTLLDHAEFSVERLRAACLAAATSHEPSNAEPIATRLRALIEKNDISAATHGGASSPKKPAL